MVVTIDRAHGRHQQRRQIAATVVVVVIELIVAKQALIHCGLNRIGMMVARDGRWIGYLQTKLCCCT